MFLLNAAAKVEEKISKIFTIQNVSIKLELNDNDEIEYTHLQYKMFLLNLIFLKLPI